MADGVARVVGNYEILGRIGGGGMGAVFRGRHRFLRDEVALKFLHPSIAQGDPQAADRFLREARIARELTHPGICRVLDFGVEEDEMYLVMELLPGKGLDQILRAGPLSVADAIVVARQLAEAMAYAHERGVIHRDLKPANVLVAQGPDGRSIIKVLDFGLARFESGSSLTLPDAVLGTPAYMAPEQYEGASKTGAPADVYSFGVIVYEMLAGKPLFPSRERAELEKAHRSQSIPALNVLGPIPEALERLVMRCLSKGPADRPAGFSEIAAVLAQLEDGATTIAPVAVGRSQRRPRGMKVAIGLAALVVVLGASVVLITRGAKEDALPAVVALPAPPDASLRVTDLGPVGLDAKGEGPAAPAPTPVGTSAPPSSPRARPASPLKDHKRPTRPRPRPASEVITPPNTSLD